MVYAAKFNVIFSVCKLKSHPKNQENKNYRSKKSKMKQPVCSWGMGGGVLLHKRAI